MSQTILQAAPPNRKAELLPPVWVTVSALGFGQQLCQRDSAFDSGRKFPKEARRQMPKAQAFASESPSTDTANLHVSEVRA